jgi:hypothetical protein
VCVCRTKLKQTEVDCELLKRCCETLTEENKRLQKELQELRAIKVAAPHVIAHDFYMPLPAATLTMCPSCERVATVDNRSVTTFPKKPGYSHFAPSPAACWDAPVREREWPQLTTDLSPPLPRNQDTHFLHHLQLLAEMLSILIHSTPIMFKGGNAGYSLQEAQANL